MKKKKLTINALAGSNLKTRKKQYAIMFVGIILAMVFSSSIVLYLFSSNETYLAQAKEKYGAQDGIVYSYNNDESVFRKAKEDGAITDYGLGHIIGYAYVSDDEANMGMSVGWLEDKAKEISHQSLLEGEYPTKENEIAVEKAALFKLGIDAKVGDEITLKIKTQSNDEYFNTKEKTYKLVGILNNKKSNIQNEFWNENNCVDVPAAFVANGTKTELGGKEKLVAYMNSDMVNRSYENSVWSYLEEHGCRFVQTCIDELSTLSSLSSFSSISENSYLMIVIVLVLVFASCIAIINSFNTNLKERKKQIGMMRAVGTTKRQIIQIFGREAFIISLICVPVSIALSYGIVWGIVSLSSENAVMTKSVFVLPACAVVCLVVTMLASLLPLLSAAKITPMQAIRDIDNTRKMKTKKIKSKKNFNVPSHLAKRNLTFYKGGLIAVSVILSITIVFSCLCFFSLADIYGNIGTIGKDYEISSLGASSSEFVNYGGGMSNADKQNIEAMPYVAKAYGEKSVVSIVEVNEITKFHKAFLRMQSVFNDGNLDDLTYENYEEKWYSEYTEEYLDTKKEFGFKNEIVPVDLFGQETEDLEILKKYVSDGEIHMNKIASGDEVVLVAPNKVKKAIRIDKDGFGFGDYCDDETITPGYQVVFEGENPYKVGDTLELTTVVCNEDTEEYKTYKKKTTIGAIITPSDLDKAIEKENVHCGSHGFSFFTSIAGINNFCENVKYENIDVYADRELDDETDKLLTDSLTEITDKYGGFIRSDYAHQKNQQQLLFEIFVSVLSIIVVGFTVCASIVNNTLTASIREKKKTIGTLRAVGASESDIVISFIKQLLSVFKWGYGIGFGLFGVIYLALYALFKYQQINKITFAESFYLSFSPWITITFCIILFGICSINLWLKIRKEMKNSIIDNIREL
ncbi:MAG: ABC transporter permease [Eubacterium sp.]|nr:ABC transporter permease [Eubacterium sp.]